MVDLDCVFRAQLYLSSFFVLSPPYFLGTLEKNIFDVCTHCFLFQVFNKHYLKCIATKIDGKNLLFHIFFYFHQKMLPEDATIHSLSWFWVIGNTYIHMYGCFINWYTLLSDFATLWCSTFIILVVSGMILGPPGHQKG